MFSCFGFKRAAHLRFALSTIFIAIPVLLIACNGANIFPPPTLAPTLPPLPTIELQPSSNFTPIPPPTTALPAQPTELPTLRPPPPPTAAPTRVPTRAPTSAPTRASSGITRVKIFLIAIGDNGQSGPVVGCGDSAVGVVREIAPTVAPLTAALRELFTLHDRDYGQSGFYNALYQSNLRLEGATIVNSVATIRITGNLTLGGVCDNPRVAAQITQTALQFATVKSVQVFLNNVPLDQVLSEK